MIESSILRVRSVQEGPLTSCRYRSITVGNRFRSRRTAASGPRGVLGGVIRGEMVDITLDVEGSERRIRLERLFLEHATAVRAYARRRIGVACADDTVGEVFVIAWRRIDDVPGDALPWLLACARRVIANQRRGASRASRLTGRLASEAHSDVRVGGTDVGLASALNGLSDRDREVLLLIAWEGLSSVRAAAVLGCSPNAFAVRLHRARKRLADALSEQDTRHAAMERMR